MMKGHRQTNQFVLGAFDHVLVCVCVCVSMCVR